MSSKIFCLIFLMLFVALPAARTAPEAGSSRNSIVFNIPALDEVALLGLSKKEALERLGQPDKIDGPEEGYQTYEYLSTHHLSVVFHDGKLVQYVVRPDATFKTTSDIGIGSFLGSVTKQYGDSVREEEVTEWFAGSDGQVLYHHPEFKKFKLIYPDARLTFFFDAERAVEWIWVGILPE